MKYPWGKKAFDDLIKSISRRWMSQKILSVAEMPLGCMCVYMSIVLQFDRRLQSRLEIKCPRLLQREDSAIILYGAHSMHRMFNDDNNRLSLLNLSSSFVEPRSATLVVNATDDPDDNFMDDPPHIPIAKVKDEFDDIAD
ncbi:hypothetical protein HAX54_013383 [Datura stramonium]|uniref:DUF1985 domain-containing protein n=1 Tax=Datura stramonium TaxID=4076 RepID=A0ABS8TP34_DATST|nr:hypothetical protein [Datura stramonium]